MTDTTEKTEILGSKFEKCRDRDKTPGTPVERLLERVARRHNQPGTSDYNDQELEFIAEMYEGSELENVATKVAVELLWQWINEIRFDGKHSDDLMLMARGAYQVTGQHTMACLTLTEMSSGIDVMAGSIRRQLSKIWLFAANNFKTSKEQEEENTDD